MPKNRRMVLADISAGMKGILTEFEKSTRSVQRAICEAVDSENAAIVDQNYDIAKQKLLRKLYRLENGTNLTDVERLKRDLRRLAKGYVDTVTDGKDDHDLYVLALSITEGKRRL